MRTAVVSLFDDSGNLMEPWLKAGFDVYLVDILNPPEGETSGKVHKIYADLTKPFALPIPAAQIAFVSAHPPCDHLAVSGARWFKGKGLRALARSVDMFATAAEFCEASGAPYMIENPVSTMSTYWRKPDYTYHPYEYAGWCPADNYTKKTCLWTGGGFIMPPKYPLDGAPPPDDRIHKCPPGPMRAYFRSVTPQGFGWAVFAANYAIASRSGAC
jgi:hypothetical protein